MNRIKELRESRGMNQQRLAIELNVSQAMISKYELGISEPDITTIKQIADFFGVSADYLLEISDEKMCVSSDTFTDEERELLFGFKHLDTLKRAKLLAYLQGLLD